MKVVHVCFSGRGGAAIAMMRLHAALLSQGTDSEVWCARDLSGIPQSRLLKGRVGRFLDSLKIVLAQKCVRFFSDNRSRSCNFFPSRLARKLNTSDADVIHLHWINGEIIRLEQLVSIKKPIVWTFHDMWPFCGAENYTNDTRYVTGYQSSGFRSLVPSNEQPKVYGLKSKVSFDLDRWVFHRKQKAWAGWRIQIVCLSRWQRDCVSKSYLFKNYPTSVISNCLDTDIFKPNGKRMLIRDKYNIPRNKNVILYGSSDLLHFRKGGDLMEQALTGITNKDRCCLVVFGDGSFPEIVGLQTVFVGRVQGDKDLADLYNCADLMCVSSRQETFGQTASEPLACGIPVVAFNSTGLKDIVDHKVNGYLAESFDPKDFARGIDWVLSRKRGPEIAGRAASGEGEGGRINSEAPQEDRSFLSKNARRKAKQMFNGSRVAGDYCAVYERAIRDFESLCLG